MTTHLPAHVPTHGPTRVPAPVLPAVLADQVRDLRGASKAPNTVRAYQADWRTWSAWCDRHGHSPLPAHPDTVSAYLADQAGTLKVSTLRRHLATISKAHQVAGLPNPCRETGVRDTVSGLRRTYGTPPNEAPGLLADHLGRTLDCLGADPLSVRDRALLLVGWCAGLRRSELTALTWADITPDPDGLVIVLRRSKTDQQGEGRSVGLARNGNPARCPVVALDQWRTTVGTLVEPGVSIDDLPVFVNITRWGKMRTKPLAGQSVALVIKRRTQQAGLPVDYRGHSLRKGLVQQAHLAGVSDSAVMATTGHHSVTMLRRYQGQAGLVSRSASRGLLT